MATSVSIHPKNLQIPIDLFVNKKHFKEGDLGFIDSDDSSVYRVNRQPSSESSSSSHKRVLFDAAGVPLFSMIRKRGGSWQGFKGNGAEEDLVFRVERTQNKLTRTELEVFLVRNNPGDPTPQFKVKGCPFMRSCTIYKGNEIVAQTSLMYKLHQIFAKRSKFRLTIFPGSVDHALVVALVVIFIDG